MAYGRLYLVATPIGNLEDITYRAVRVLREVDVIACEDTRRTRKLCSYYDITTQLISYHEHNELDRAPELIQMMKKGKDLALVSDAGTPAISDPGERIVREALVSGLEVVPIPGPCAAVTALSASGLSTSSFLFIGFLPRQSVDRRRKLKEVSLYPHTLVFYVSPHRFLDVVQDIHQVCGERRIVVARELTKMHEEFRQTTVSEVLEQGWRPQGEICLLVAGARKLEEQMLTELSVLEHVQFYQQAGLSRKEALKRVAADRKVSKREVYRALLEEEGKL